MWLNENLQCRILRDKWSDKISNKEITWRSGMDTM